MSKALVIFSGGQDSTTCLGWAMNKFDEVEAITFIYGQKHSIEVKKSKDICKKLNIKQNIIDISFFSKIVDSALTSNGDVNVKHDRLKDLPASFVPNRNAMFITISHALAQKINASTLITGTCETDFSGYPDCRDNFIKSLNVSLNIGSDVNIKIETPLMWLNKKQTWELAEKENIFNIVKDMTITCYNGVEKQNEWGLGCSECPSCKLRKKGYDEYVQDNQKIGNSRQS